MKANYETFIFRLMQTTGLPLSQMQTFEEWIENRKAQFEKEANENEKIKGFQSWLDEKY